MMDLFYRRGEIFKIQWWKADIELISMIGTMKIKWLSVQQGKELRHATMLEF